jgi:hypothetical protein
MHSNNHTPTAKQIATRDALMAEGYKHKGWKEYPTTSRRKNAPPDACMVMCKDVHTPRTYSSITTQINPDGTTT